MIIAYLVKKDTAAAAVAAQNSLNDIPGALYCPIVL